MNKINITILGISVAFLTVVIVIDDVRCAYLCAVLSSRNTDNKTPRTSVLVLLSFYFFSMADWLLFSDVIIATAAWYFRRSERAQKPNTSWGGSSFSDKVCVWEGGGGGGPG